jgi:hypothetical protein
MHNLHCSLNCCGRVVYIAPLYFFSFWLFKRALFPACSKCVPAVEFVGHQSIVRLGILRSAWVTPCGSHLIIVHLFLIIGIAYFAEYV